MYIIIAGIGVVGSQVTKTLVEHKHDVIAIDLDRNACETMYEETGVTSIYGSATDIKVLNNAGSDKADIMVCLMRNDSDNIAATLIAKSLGIPKVIACLRKPGYENAYNAAGVDGLIQLPHLLLNNIIVEIEQPEVKKIIDITNNISVFALKMLSEKNSGKTIKEISTINGFPEKCIFLGIFKEDKNDFKIPRGKNIVKKNDTIFLISNQDDVKKVLKILR